MFSGIVDKILLGIIAALLIYIGLTYVKYNWFEKPAYQKEIRDLQDAGIKAQAQIYKQQTEIADLEKTKQAHGRQSHENQDLEQMVSTGDDTRMRQYFIDHGMLPAPQNKPAKPEAAGPQHQPGAPAGTPALH